MKMDRGDPLGAQQVRAAGLPSRPVSSLAQGALADHIDKWSHNPATTIRSGSLMDMAANPVGSRFTPSWTCRSATFVIISVSTVTDSTHKDTAETSSRETILTPRRSGRTYSSSLTRSISLAPIEDFRRDSDLFGEDVGSPAAQEQLNAAFKRGFQSPEGGNVTGTSAGRTGRPLTGGKEDAWLRPS